MLNTKINIDSDLWAEFIDESMDMLFEVDALFVQLEENPTSRTLIDKIFRPIHSIKGNSSFFGLTKTKTISHEMESLLDQVRKKTLQITPDLINVLLKGVDLLKEILGEVQKNQTEKIDQTAFEKIIQDIKTISVVQPENEKILWQKLISDLDVLKKELGNNPLLLSSMNTLNTLMLRIVPEVTPDVANQSGPIQKIKEILSDEIKDFLEKEKSDEILRQLRILINESKDPKIKESLEKIINNCSIFISSVGFDNLLRDMILKDLAKLPKQQSILSPVIVQEESKTDLENDDDLDINKDDEKQEIQKTMRVAERHIDTFMEYVGELLIIGDMFNYIQKQIIDENVGSNIVEGFKQANLTFSTLSNNLQDSIMSIRKVPIRILFQKISRVVRDLANRSNKEVEVVLSGESITIDKSIIDMIDSPLMHLVRNAVDHGLEIPDIRMKAGKSRKGKIIVKAEETSNSIDISVEDDGSGLDQKKIIEKAKRKGLIPADKEIDKNLYARLIFSPGFSTKEKVSEVSGRGVGLDVVKRMIDETGGKISISTQPNKGCRFRMQFLKSVTTQIIHGFLIDVGGQTHVFPMNKVKETIKVEKDKIKVGKSQGQYFIRHEKMIPILPLSKILNISAPKNDDNSYELVVSLLSRQKNFAVIVNKVIGVQYVVSRNIEGLNFDEDMISGAALMGDGSVALILNVDKLYTNSN